MSTSTSRARHGGASGRATGAVIGVYRAQIDDFWLSFCQKRGLLSLFVTTFRGLVHPKSGGAHPRGIFSILSSAKEEWIAGVLGPISADT